MTITYAQRMKEYLATSNTAVTSSGTITNTADSLMFVGVHLNDTVAPPSVSSISSSALSDIQLLKYEAEPVNGLNKFYMYTARGTGTAATLTANLSGGTGPYNVGFIVYELSEANKFLRVLKSASGFISVTESQYVDVSLPSNVDSETEVLFTLLGSSGNSGNATGYTQFYQNTTSFYTEAWYEPTPSGTAQFYAQEGGSPLSGLYVMAEIGPVLNSRIISVMQS